MLSSLRWGRSTRRTSRATTASCGPGASGEYVGRFVSPRRNVGRLSCLGYSAIATSLDAPCELESTPLLHLPPFVYFFFFWVRIRPRVQRAGGGTSGASLDLDGSGTLCHW